MSGENIAEFNEFLESWLATGQEMATVYQELCSDVLAMEGVSFNFTGRAGVSYSLRPVHAKQESRKFFAIMDVIDDDPEDRWLSICFYGDMITDTEGRGEVVPGGLGGDDGYCFDMYAPDKDMAAYLKSIIKNAWQSASR